MRSGDMVRSSLRPSDQQDLIWFFGDGQVAFERSTFGYQLERAELFTFGSMPCKRCDGTGYTTTPEQAIAASLEALKKWQIDNDARIRAGRTRARCGDENANPRVPADYDDGTCRSCTGAGWVPRKSRYPRGGPVTAKPVHAPTRPAAQEPSTDALERYGSVSHHLAKLSKHTVATLGAFFGIFGAHWEDDPHRGRLWPVRAMTPAATKLLKSGKNRARDTGADRELRQDELLHVLAELETIQPQRQRGLLLALTLTQAQQMLAEAESDWSRATWRAAAQAAPGAALPPQTGQSGPAAFQARLDAVEALLGGLA